MLKGSITALLTPFKDGEVDLSAFRTFVDWQISEGTNALVVSGTTGESPTLSFDEHTSLVEAAIDVSGSRVPVVVGCGANNTRKAVAMAEHARSVRADAVLVVAPYYNKPTPAGQLAHFRAVHDAADLPFILYNIPGRTGIDVSTATMLDMQRVMPHFMGIKDATGDLARPAEQRDALGDGFVQLSGEDMTAIGFNAMGGVGCISVTSNIAPKMCAEMQAATLDGDFDHAMLVHEKLVPLHRAMFLESNPGPAKYAFAKLGLGAPELRLPMVPPSAETCAQIDAAMTLAGLTAVE